ncbi:MAG TPA: DUF5666 domain-containing protein [Candidatus Angelobacter sp.]|nr:DUF5666 domain-containing protein [Candidatus Angelobacter sp.]
MNCPRRLAIWIVAAAFMLIAPWIQATLQAQQGNAAAAARSVGTVKSINGQTLVLKPDSGPDVNVSLSDGTRILRLAPGQTDLKSATPLAISDLQVGDRMLVRGHAGENDSIAAAAIIVMKQADVAQKQQHDREDWQKRGVGGIVSAIDPASGTITVSVTPTVSITVKTSKDTSFLRYAPDSIKFADAKKSTLDQIKTGDQLRARGTRSADGKEIAAEEVISGSFRNIAGTITSIDTANNAITVKDILAKKSVVVKFNADSQLRKLSQPMAQRLAFFLKARTESGQGGAPGGGASRPGGGPDFQQVLSRIPSIKLEDLQKEDAVMIVAMPGTNNDDVTAVTLLGGVEPILTASPNGTSAAALFSGWNLGAPAGDAGP